MAHGPLTENGLSTSGPTSRRPTNAEIGQPYFDTDLGVMLHYGGGTLGWVGTHNGFLELPLRNFAAVQSNDVPNIAGTPAGGVLALNSAPAFKRANAATDKALQILWAASSSVEITQGFVTPPDMDLSKNFNVSLLAAMAGLTDTPTVAIDVFGATGDTNRGGNTPALGLAPLTPPPVPVSITVTPGNSTTPNFFSISITPGAHTTDALSLYGAYITYSRKP